eukprot:m.157369 g.157369  ORF g.157369 m.157369 type:complete len:951 (-) comp17581_c0_seq6:64-2916(-)
MADTAATDGTVTPTKATPPMVLETPSSPQPTAESDIAGTAPVRAFLSSALVCWLKKFKRPTTACDTVEDFANGIFLNQLMADMDAERFGDNELQIKDPAVDGEETARLHNLGLLLETVTEYYQDVLQTVVVMELPVLRAICRDPGSELGLEALNKLLLLVVGCAVLCEQRESYIAAIQTLDRAQQINMMRIIQEILDTGLFQVPLSSLEDMPKSEIEELCRSACARLNTAAAERDNYKQRLDELRQEYDFAVAEQTRRLEELQPSSPERPSPSRAEPSSARHFETVRELKMRLRSLSDELDQKVVALEELLMEDASNKQVIAELSSKLRSLAIEADEAQHLRDDLDVWKTKAADCERHKLEAQRYREKLEDFEYAKKRIEELKEQNALLVQQNEKLRQTQNGSSEMKTKLVASDREVRTLRIQLEELHAASDKTFEKLREASAAKLRLENDFAYAQRELIALQKEVESLKQQQAQPSASKEVGDQADAEQILELKSANSALRRQVDQLKVEAGEVEALRATNEMLTRTQAGSGHEMDVLKLDLEDKTARVKQLQEEIARLNTDASKAADTAKAGKMQVEVARVRQLETQLDETLAKSVKLKEERIKVLEARLADSAKQTDQLKEEVRVYKKHNEFLRQAADDMAASSTFSPSIARRLGVGKDASSSTNNQTGQEPETIKKQAMLQETIKTLQSVNKTLASEAQANKSKLKAVDNSYRLLKQRETKLEARLKIHEALKDEIERENKTLMTQMNKLLLQNQQLLLKHVTQKEQEDLRSLSADSVAEAHHAGSSSAAVATPSPPRDPEKKRRGILGKRVLQNPFRRGQSQDRFATAAPEPVGEVSLSSERSAAESTKLGVEEFLMSTHRSTTAPAKQPFPAQGQTAMEFLLQSRSEQSAPQASEPAPKTGKQREVQKENVHDISGRSKASRSGKPSSSSAKLKNNTWYEYGEV